MSNIEDIYTDISNAINRSNEKYLKTILESHKNLNLLQDEGDFFDIPFEEKQFEIIKILLEYFVNVQLLESEDDVRYQLKSEFKKIVNELITDYGCSKEIHEVLSLYLGNINDNYSTISENNSDLALDEDLVNKVIRLEKTTDTSDNSPEKDNFSESDSFLDKELDVQYTKSVMNRYHLDGYSDIFSDTAREISLSDINLVGNLDN